MKLSKQEEAYLAAIGSDLKVFLRQAFETIYPGKAFLDNWHIDAIVHCLERSIEGHMPRLIINLPPRQLKSFIVSVALPAFILGVDPSAKIICISYSDDLAKALARDFKRIIESAWYRKVFPDVRPTKMTESEFATDQGGTRYATSVGGTLTGRGGRFHHHRRPDQAGRGPVGQGAPIHQRVVQKHAVEPAGRQGEKRPHPGHAAPACE